MAILSTIVVRGRKKAGSKKIARVGWKGTHRSTALLERQDTGKF
jgi:hypothetical protein